MSRRRRWLLFSVLGVVLLAALGLIFSTRAITHPSVDHASRADAVVLLSGDLGERLPEALHLVRAGVAPRLVIDGVADLPQSKELCRMSPEFEVICLKPSPDNTHSEAKAAAVLAQNRGWHSLIVVTDKVHVTRARMLFDRCVTGSVAVVAVAPPAARQPGLRAIAHEWLGALEALTLNRGC